MRCVMDGRSNFLLIALCLSVPLSSVVYGNPNECPVNSIKCWTEFDTTSVETSEGVKDITCRYEGGEGRIGYDLPAGKVWTTMDAKAVWPIHTFGVAADTYWLTGKDNIDVPLSFKAVVAIEILSGSTAKASAFVREGLTADNSIHHASNDTTMIFNLQKRVGEPFDFLFGVEASDLYFHQSSARIDLSFEVPTGMSITSCQGFQGDVVPVPVRPTTWGQIKARYGN